MQGQAMCAQGPHGESILIGPMDRMGRLSPSRPVDHPDGDKIDSLINRYNPYRAHGVDEAACQHMRQSLAKINASLEGCKALGGSGGHGGHGDGFGGRGGSDPSSTQKGKNEAGVIMGQFGDSKQL